MLDNTLMLRQAAIFCCGVVGTSERAMKKLRWLVLLAILLVVLPACQARPSRTLSLVSDTLPHCWLDICPGTTTRAEVRQILKESPGVWMQEDPRATSDAGISWGTNPSLEEQGITAGAVLFSDDRVWLLRVVVEPALTLEEALSRFGEPSFVVGRTAVHEGRTLDVTFIYPSSGLLVRHIENRWQSEDTTKASVDADLLVYELTLFVPEDWRNVVDFHIGDRGGDGTTDIESEIHPWQGWGTLVPLEPY